MVIFISSLASNRVPYWYHRGRKTSRKSSTRELVRRRDQMNKYRTKKGSLSKVIPRTSVRWFALVLVAAKHNRGWKGREANLHARTRWKRNSSILHKIPRSITSTCETSAFTVDSATGVCVWRARSGRSGKADQPDLAPPKDPRIVQDSLGELR